MWVGCLEGICRLEGVGRLSAGCECSVWSMLTGCLEGMCRVFGM